MSSQTHLSSKENKPLPYELLVMYRQRSGLTQLQLAALLGLKGERMVQLWEGGYYLPRATRLKKLVEVYLDRGVFVASQERFEARELWKAVKDLADANSSNFETYPIFDEGWFENLLQSRGKGPGPGNKVTVVAGVESKKGIEPEAPGERERVAGSKTSPNNLPAPVNPFIGRGHEIQAVSTLVREGELRLVTLVGPGGIGKTRLALEVASGLLASFPDGVWLVELAPHSDPRLVAQLVARALGLKEEPGEGVSQALLYYLQSKKLLLVLDNCEHLVEACAELARVWLRSCPKLRILATSRETLGLDSECLWQVDPLPVEIPVEPISKDPLQSEAVRLFLARARAISPAFSPGTEELLAIGQICRLLEGIPLAIELAAARVKILSTGQILERLSGAFEERFGLLGGNRRTTPPRHQTLKASLDWSYNLLPEEERQLFCQLSVFAGSWSLVAAEEVGAVPQVLDLLIRLVDKSLVEVVAGRQGKAGASRYRMLETVRQYAFSRLEEGEELEVSKERHLDFFLRMAEQIEPEARAGGPDWRAKLEIEYPNIRAALAWGLEGKGVENRDIAQKALRLVSALHHFWDARGLVTEGREWLVKALEITPVTSEEMAGLRVRAKALKVLGALTGLQGDPGASVKYLEESLVLYRKLQDKREIAGLISQFGIVAWMHGDDRRAIELSEEAANLYRELGDRVSLGATLNGLGSASTYLGKAEKAETHLKEALSINRATNHRANLAISIFELGILYWTQGDLASARRYLEESLAIRREVGNNLGVGGSLLFLAMLEWTEGNNEQAIQLLEEGWAIMKNWRMFFSAASYPLYLGLVYMDKGNYEKAKGYLEEGLELSKKTDNWRDIPAALEGQAFLLIRTGEPERAAWLLGAAEALRERIGFPLFPVLRERYGREKDTLLKRPGREKLEDELEKGRKLGPQTLNIF